MNKEIRVVDKDKGIVRVTTVDERWYAKPLLDATTGLPTSYLYVPSVTWICDFYPKGVGFYKWLATTGWDEAQAIKEAAGERGSKVHHAIDAWLHGADLSIDDGFVTGDSNGQPIPLTLDEWDAVCSFVDWAKQAKPTILDTEFVVWNDTEHYAGTVDLLCEIAGERWLIDFKTSKAIYPSHEMQVSAYKHADEPRFTLGMKLGILQLGYARNKKRWNFTQIDDQFPLFLSARSIWAKETDGSAPKQKDYPIRIPGFQTTTAAPEAALGRTPSATAVASTNGG